MLASTLLPLLARQANPDFTKLRHDIAAAQRKTTVPGLSLAVVKDGKVIFAEGFGYADLAKRKRATPDTVFPIGSATKSFTALLATQAQVEGRLSLKDRPSKYLPAFRLKDPKTNEKITVEDLLSHRSGLPRTDLVWYASDFNRDDLLALLAEEEPTAPLGAAWQYQNLMFLVAGLVEEKAYGKPYETLLDERFFRPLGMAHSSVTEAATRAERTLATGYSAEGRALPFKPIDHVAPAGSVASTAHDMAKYVRMLLADGQFEGRQVFAKEAVEETRKPRIAMVPGSKQMYGLGWMLGEDDGVKRVFHGGNIDGFSAMVTLVPEKGIGVVALSNGDSATLPSQATEIALDALLPKSTAKKASLVEATAAEMGRYVLAKPPVDLTFSREGKTVSFTQNGRTFPLELVGPKRYTLQKIVYVTFGGTDKEAKKTVKIEQGGLTFELLAAAPYKAPITAEELLAKTVEAAGGAEAIRRHPRYVIHLHSRMPSDASDQYTVRWQRDPASQAEYTHFYALNRRFAETADATDDRQTREWSTFRPATVKKADKEGAIGIFADLEPAKAYRSLTILREDKVGDMPVYVLEKKPYSGGAILEFISKADGRVLRRSTGAGSLASVQDFSDFHNVDGLILPFHIVVTTATGTKVVQDIDSVRFDEYVPNWPWRIEG